MKFDIKVEALEKCGRCGVPVRPNSGKEPPHLFMTVQGPAKPILMYIKVAMCNDCLASAEFIMESAGLETDPDA